MRLRVPAEAGSLRTVRHRLEEWLGAVGASAQAAADVVLAVNEACANAVEHPVSRRKPWIDLSARHERGRVEVVVSDSGSWREGASDEDRGRGLRLMRAFMDEVAVETGPHGTTIRLGRRVG